MKYLNLGCGKCYHSDWINVDFISDKEDVIAYDLRKGIPFDASTMDVVYHSHILEHFTKSEGIKFISECYRVLKPGGIIRVVVPDLEAIVREYLDKLQKALNGDTYAMHDYDWILLELFDQMVRNKSGGQMAEYLYRKEIYNLDYVYSRIGQEGRNIREQFINNKNIPSDIVLKSYVNIFRKIICYLKKVFKKAVFKSKYQFDSENEEALKIGNFRLSGEIHQWMYDRFSLSQLLLNAGFNDIQIQTHKMSYIDNWNTYLLDTLLDGNVRKPDSLFIEAKK